MSSLSSTPSTTTASATTASDTPFFTNSPSPTGGGGGGGGGGFGSGSTPLYLFTFLATLFVLLFVSCAIVLRSFFLRRRLRQRIDQAMAAGMWPLPPELGGPGLRRRGFGEKPQLWDASLGGINSDDGWEKLKPVSVRLISYESDASPNPAPQPKTALLHKINPFSNMRSWRRSRSASSSSSLTAPDLSASLEPPDSSSSPAAEDTPLNASEVEVSVIIAMPDPHRPSNGHSPAEFVSGKGKERLSSADSYWSEHEEGVPDVVLASCRIPIKVTDSNGSLES